MMPFNFNLALACVVILTSLNGCSSVGKRDLDSTFALLKRHETTGTPIGKFCKVSQVELVGDDLFFKIQHGERAPLSIQFRKTGLFSSVPKLRMAKATANEKTIEYYDSYENPPQPKEFQPACVSGSFHQMWHYLQYALYANLTIAAKDQLMTGASFTEQSSKEGLCPQAHILPIQQTIALDCSAEVVKNSSQAPRDLWSAVR